MLKLAAKLVVILAISILLLLPRTTLFYFLLSNIDMVGVISPQYSEIPTQVDQKHAWLLCSYIEIGALSLRIARGEGDTILPTL